MIGHEILHAARILAEIVEAELVKAVIGDSGIIVVEFELVAEMGAALPADGGEGGIALGSDGNVLDQLAVDHGIAGDIRFLGGMGGHVLPVLLTDENVDGVDAVGIEQAVFVGVIGRNGADSGFGRFGSAGLMGIEPADRDQHGRQCQHDTGQCGHFLGSLGSHHGFLLVVVGMLL